MADNNVKNFANCQKSRRARLEVQYAQANALCRFRSELINLVNATPPVLDRPRLHERERNHRACRGQGLRSAQVGSQVRSLEAVPHSDVRGARIQFTRRGRAGHRYGGALWLRHH